MTMTKSVFVVNERTCSHTGAPVRACKCGGHGTNNAAFPSYREAHVTMNGVTFNTADDDVLSPFYGEARPVTNAADSLLLNRAAYDGDELPLPQTDWRQPLYPPKQSA